MPSDSLPLPAPNGSPCEPDETLDVDANAASPVTAEAWQAFVDSAHLREAPGVHTPGARAAAAALSEHVAAAASSLDVDPSSVVPTVGGSAADALALLATLRPGDRLVISPLEHEAVAALAHTLSQRRGVQLDFLPLDNYGRVDPQKVEQVIGPRTRLVSCMAANNETGVIQPVAAIAARAREVGALFHCDAVQALGRIDTSVIFCDEGPDLVAVAGHKVGAVGHTGLLVVKPRARPFFHPDPLASLCRGDGRHVAGFASLAAALRHLPDATQWQQWTDLRDGVVEQLRRAQIALSVLGECHPRLPNTLGLCLWGFDAEAVVMALDQAKVAVSAGAACASGSTEASPTLLAMGLTPQQARMCLRLSFQRNASANMGQRVAQVLCQILQQPSARAR